jgi:hypothetical protein
VDAAPTRSHGSRVVRTPSVPTRLASHVAFPLVVGAVAYASWRATDVRLVAWMARLAPGGLAMLRGAARSHARAPGLILGSLPDAAWAWAFGASLSLLWIGRPWREKAPWLGAGAMLAVLTELGQAAGLVPGTFDPCDLVAIALGFAGGAALAGRVGRPVPSPASEA